MAMTEAKTTRAERGRKTVTKALDHMEIHHSKNGGHLIVHHFHPESHGLGGGSNLQYAVNPGGKNMEPVKMPEHHVFGPSEGNEMLAHVSEHMEAKANPEPSESKKEETEQEDEEDGESEA